MALSTIRERLQPQIGAPVLFLLPTNIDIASDTTSPMALNILDIDSCVDWH
jgi:hypothetical protein